MALGVGAWELGPGEPHVAWVRGLSDALRPSASGGGYVNEIGDQPARTGYTDAAWERLRQRQGALGPRERVPAQREHPAGGVDASTAH